MSKVKVTRAQVRAARLTVEINEKLGRETPDAVIRLAATPLSTDPVAATTHHS